MKKPLTLVAVLLFMLPLFSCANIMAELKGEAKPNVEPTEPVPKIKNYTVSFDRVWLAVTDTLVDKDIIYEADTAIGKIETEWFEIQKISGWEAMFAGSNYSAKEFITVRRSGAGTSVQVQGRFKKEFMSVWVTEDKKFPEAESFLRKRFFEDLDAALGIPSTSAVPPKPETPSPVPPPPVTSDVPRKKIMVSCGNMRSEASRNSNVVSKLYYGQEIDILSKSGPWYQVMTPSGQKGWAHEILFETPQRQKPVVSPQAPAKPAPVAEETTASASSVSQPKQPPAQAPAAPGPVAEETTASASSVSQPKQPPAQEPASDDNIKGNQKKPTDTPKKTQASATAPIAEGKYVRTWDKGPARLLEKPNAFAPEIGSIPPGTRVAYSAVEANFYLVEYEGKRGYLYKACCEEIK